MAIYPLIKKNIISENFSQYIGNDKMVEVFHFSKSDNDSIFLDPNHFGKNYFSKAEKRVSSFPRVFFYLNLNHKERFFNNPVYSLYKTTIPAYDIYDLRTDNESIIQLSKDDNNGVLSFDILFDKIKNNFGYKGVYYRVSDMDIIVYLEQINVYKKI